METRTYTERSNARRAARAFGVDLDLITETEDGFTFPLPIPSSDSNEVGADTSADQMKAAHADAETPKVDDDAIPAFCKIPAEQRKASWIKNPPKAGTAKPEITMAKAKTTKRSKGEKKSGAGKTATLLKMLSGKGSTVEQLTKALDWLPHTLRARISRLPKDDKKIKIERERVDGVTSYRITS